MQDLNEDLDDLFRHAVDKFELKPVLSKWDELSGRIISIKRPSTLADTIRSKYRKWMMLVVLIFLLPIAVLLVMPVFNGYKTTKAKTQATAIQAEIQKNTSEPVNLKTNKTQNQESMIHNPGVTPHHGQSVVLKRTPSNTSVVPDENELSVSENSMKNVLTLDKRVSTYSEPAIKNLPADLMSPFGLTLTQTYPKSIEFPFGKNELSPPALNSNTHTNLPLQHLDYPRRQGFYLGLVAGPMLTQVKHQGLNKSGFDFGLLAGYTFSKKFSIETGLMYTKQYYYVTGKYYNEFASVTNVSSLEGSRNAFEIPLTIKYNVTRRPGGNFFVSAGASSYVGVNDKIRVILSEGALPPSVHFDYGVTSWLPSYINFSLGYEYKIGKFADIRIEPYFQIPMSSSTGNSFKTASSGGSIQVFNTGIHIGITRFIR